MSIDELQSFLGWCFLLNFAILLVWFVLLAFARGFVYRLHGNLFPMSDETFNSIHYSGMAFYKLLNIMFFLIPWIVLKCLV